MCVCLCTVCVCGERSAVCQPQRVLIYCQRIPSDQVQFSSPALISSPHQGLPPSRPVFHSLALTLPPAFPLTATHQANPDHTRESNHSWQFKLALFSLSLPRKKKKRKKECPTCFRCTHMICLPFVCMSLFLKALMSIKKTGAQQ